MKTPDADDIARRKLAVQIVADVIDKLEGWAEHGTRMSGYIGPSACRYQHWADALKTALELLKIDAEMN